MPERRQWWLLVVLVLALHGLALLGLPLRAADFAPSHAPVFQTRMVPPPAPPTPEVEQAVVAPTPAAPAVAPPPQLARPKPVPKPARVEPTPVVQQEGGAAAAAAVLPATELAPQESVAEEPVVEEATPEALASVPEPVQPVPESEVVQLAQADEALLVAAAASAARPSSQNPQHNAPAVRLPPPTLLSFDVQGQAKTLGYSATAELLWQHDGANYQARQQVKVFLLGARVQTSVGSLTEQGLRPTRFGDKARNEKAAHFEYDKGQIIFSSSTERPPLPSGAQDRLSVFIQLGAMLAAAPQRYRPGSQITLPTVGTRSIDPWTFTVEAEETLDLPIGATPALRLQRLPRKAWDQNAQLWLGRDLNYLPVRIRLTQENGDFVDLLLSAHNPP